MSTREEIANFVLRKTSFQPPDPVAYLLADMGVQLPQMSSEQLAQELIQDAEFRSLQLGAWLTTPDGQLIAEGVALALPPLVRPEYHLWVQAMQMTAQLQRQEGEKVAGRVSLGVMLVGAVLAIGIMGGRS